MPGLCASVASDPMRLLSRNVSCHTEPPRGSPVLDIPTLKVLLPSGSCTRKADLLIFDMVATVSPSRGTPQHTHPRFSDCNPPPTG